MKYSLRSLMIAVLVLPPLLAVAFAVGVRLMAEPERMPAGGSNFDDVQYFQPGPEFKLSREAAALKAFKADLEAQRGLPNSQPPAPNPR